MHLARSVGGLREKQDSTPCLSSDQRELSFTEVAKNAKHVGAQTGGLTYKLSFFEKTRSLSRESKFRLYYTSSASGGFRGLKSMRQAVSGGFRLDLVNLLRGVIEPIGSHWLIHMFLVSSKPIPKPFQGD